jgi:hypothetical protein
VKTRGHRALSPRVTSGKQSLDALLWKY